MGRPANMAAAAVAAAVIAASAIGFAGEAASERGERPAAATPAAAAPTSKRISPDPGASPHRSAVYGELAGKTGFWGAGYDYALVPRLAVGVTASVTWPSGETEFAVIPYLHAELVTDGHHSWFAEVGPLIAYVHADSPVPEWSGVTSSSVGAELASGYEYRSRFLFRGFLSITVGAGVTAPWGGVAFGWTF